MLHTWTNAGRWRSSLLGIGGAALLLATWVAVEVERLRAGHDASAIAAWPAGDSFGLICNLVAAPLPAIGAALIPAALAALAPCLLQMSTVLVTALAGALARERQLDNRLVLKRAGLLFAGGFLSVYGLAAVAVGLTGAALASYAFVLRVAGGLLLLLLGLAVLRALPRALLSGCRGPRWLLLTGKASLRRPLGAGVAFAIYCVGCCGPYLGGLALLGAGSGAGWQGAALTVGLALAMGSAILLPIIALPASQRLGHLLRYHARLVATLAGTVLVTIGAALLAEPALVWVVLRSSG